MVTKLDFSKANNVYYVKNGVKKSANTVTCNGKQLWPTGKQVWMSCGMTVNDNGYLVLYVYDEDGNPMASISTTFNVTFSLYGRKNVSSEWGSVMEVSINTSPTAAGNLRYITTITPGQHTMYRLVAIVKATGGYSGARFESCSESAGSGSGEAFMPNGEHTFGEWSEWEVTREATCTEDGVKTRRQVCTICGLENVETVAIESGHKFGDWSDWVVTSEKGHSTDGVKERKRTCSVCGNTDVETEVDKAEGHTYVSYGTSVGKEPTCTESGYNNAHYRCSVCGQEQVRILYIPKLDHDWYFDHQTVYVEPTCTEGGKVTSVFKCSNCGDEVSYDGDIPSNGHDYTDWGQRYYSRQSCTTDEVIYHWRTCRTCLYIDNYYETTVKATGHTWTYHTAFYPNGNGTHERQDTCDTCGTTRLVTRDCTGSSGSKCSYCGAKIP